MLQRDRETEAISVWLSLCYSISLYHLGFGNEEIAACNGRDICDIAKGTNPLIATPILMQRWRENRDARTAQLTVSSPLHAF